MTKTKKPKVKKEFDKLLTSFNKDMLDAALMFDESGWTDKLLDFIQTQIKASQREVLERVRLRKALIIPNLHQVFKKPIDRAGHIGTVTGYNRAVDLLNQKIKKEIEEK